MSSRSSACDAGGHVSNFDASWLSAKQSNACKVAARTTRLHACKARMGGRLALCGDDRILGHLRVGNLFGDSPLADAAVGYMCVIS